jgi:hypothetical protein
MYECGSGFPVTQTTRKICDSVFWVWNVILQVAIPVVDDFAFLLKIGAIYHETSFIMLAINGLGSSEIVFDFLNKRFHESRTIFDVLFVDAIW